MTCYPIALLLVVLSLLTVVVDSFLVSSHSSRNYYDCSARRQKQQEAASAAAAVSSRSTTTRRSLTKEDLQQIADLLEPIIASSTRKDESIARTTNDQLTDIQSTLNRIENTLNRILDVRTAALGVDNTIVSRFNETTVSSEDEDVVVVDELMGPSDDEFDDGIVWY